MYDPLKRNIGEELTNIHTDSIVNSGIWLSVEVNIGILSVCVPLMRPLFSKTFPSAIRSRFTKSHTPRYAAGSQRLPDTEKANKSSTLGSRTGQLYTGGSRKHKTWYNNTASASRAEEDRSDGSQEDMVPMGKIAVRHDVRWEEGDTLP